MKKIIFISAILLIVTANVGAQISLTYEKHALRIEDKPQTYITDFIDQGESGKNKVWDFTALANPKPHEAEIIAPYQTTNLSDFPKANTVIFEGGNYFYFNIDGSTNDFLGWINKSAVIKLDKPNKKMVYPFSYGEKFSSDYIGHTVVSKIYGRSSVEADAYGTLLLPGNITVKNVLRVKSEEQMVEEACQSIELKTTKYMFYSEDYRYPLLIVFKRTENFTTSENPREFKYCVVAAHLLNNNKSEKPQTGSLAMVEKPEIRVFPNPYVDAVKIEYILKQEASVNIDVFNLTGSKVASLVSELSQKADNYLISFSPSKYNLVPATYIVRFRIGNYEYEQQIIGVDK